MKKYIIAMAVVVIVLGSYIFGTYNSLVSLSESVDGQWAQVESQYQRRFDLIPNLVNVAKGFATQEKTVFADIAEARTRYSGAQTTDEKVRAVNQVESALGRLLVITENYPNLVSSQNFKDVSIGLEGSENRISVERKRFNELVQSYNVGIKTVPTSWVASYFGFGEREYFESSDGSENAPAVQF